MVQSFEEFLEKIDIVDVISQYISLKRVGSNFMAPCPFHNETKPSFSVSPTRQFYHCFGCNAGGNAITFIQNFENVSFREAIELLSRKYSIPFTFKQGTSAAPEKQREREEIQEAFSFLFSMFQQYLASSHKESLAAMKYLEERGFDNKIIREFQLGYIPADGKIVIQRLRQTYKELKLFFSLGILGKRKDGTVYSKLSGRITFPIYDQLGRGIALGARVIHSGEPKYINSPENILFQKSKVFYGWHQAKAHVNKCRRLIISEGYFDVIRLHQKGYSWSVATLGTSLTDHHARLLKRTGATVFLIFDADEAGIKAALRGVSHLLPHEIPYRIIMLPAGEDPDSYLINHPSNEFSDLLQKGYNIVELLYKHTLETEGFISSEKKNEIIKTILPLIETCPNAIIREEYLSLLSRLLGVGLHSLQLELRNLRKFQRRPQSGENAPSSTEKKSPQTPEEKLLKKLISIFILDPSLAPLYEKAIDFDLLEDNLPKQVLLLLLKLDIQTDDFPGSILDTPEYPPECQAMIRQLIIENEEYMQMEESELARHSFAYLEKLAHLEIKKKIQYQKNRMNLTQDLKEKQKLFEQLYEYIEFKNNPHDYLGKKLEELKNSGFNDLDH